MKNLRASLAVFALFSVAAIAAYGQAGQTNLANPPCASSFVLNADTTSGATLLVTAPSGAASQTYLGGASGNPVQGNFRGKSVHICAADMKVVQTTTAANYGLTYGFLGGLTAVATASSQTTGAPTYTGTSTQTCNVQLNDSGGHSLATAILALTGTNAVAGSTSLSSIVPEESSSAAGLTIGTGSQAVIGVLSNGTATCGGTVNLVATTGGSTAYCAGAINLTPQWLGVASLATDGRATMWGKDSALTAPAGANVCFNLSAVPTASQVLITYSLF